MCNFIGKLDCVTCCSGHPINDRVRCEETVPPVYVWDSRPNPEIVVILLPTQRKDSRPGWSLLRLPRTSVSEVASPASDNPVLDSSAGLHAGGL